jgi:hypothetical protein
LHSSAVSVLLASNLEFFSAWSMPCLYVACDHAAKASQPVREEVCKIFAWSLDYFLRDFLSVHCWRLYFVGALLVDEYQILCRVVKVCLCPALPPLRIPPLEGRSRVVCDARMCSFWCCPQLEGGSSFPTILCSSCFRLPLAPILLANSPKSLEGSTQGGVAATGLEDAPRP